MRYEKVFVSSVNIRCVVNMWVYPQSRDGVLVSALCLRSEGGEMQEPVISIAAEDLHC
jgi:hypothetical protein